MTSTLAYLEVQSALQRRLRQGELSLQAVEHATNELDTKTRDFGKYPVEPRLIDGASSLIVKHSMRALDALQLASCLAVCRYLRPGEEFLFIAADIRLLGAAQAEGLTVWNPAESKTAPDVAPSPVNL